MERVPSHGIINGNGNGSPPPRCRFTSPCWPGNKGMDVVESLTVGDLIKSIEIVNSEAMT